jgi:hypothetical protein
MLYFTRYPGVTLATKIPKSYAEIVEFFAAGTTPQSIVNFQLSDEGKEYIEDLIYRYKTEGLTKDEQQELDRFLVLEHLITLIKARAHAYIKAG